MEIEPYDPSNPDFVLAVSKISDIWNIIGGWFEDVYIYPFTFSTFLGIIGVIVLLMLSALISGSEVAFFSITPSDQSRIKERSEYVADYVENLRSTPQRLLATILITNNFINVGMIILSTYVAESLFDFSQIEWLGFVFQVVVITFLLLLFGEIIPKVYASQYNVRFASFMAYPILFLERVFRPVSYFLIASTSIVDNQLTAKPQEISMDELSDAIDIAGNSIEDDKEILERIVRYVNIEAREIMRPRIDVVTLEYSANYSEVMETITNNPYSRIPVYQDTFDSVYGILYVKDLIKHIKEPDDFQWQDYLKEPYFIPENKNINELLTEFQQEKKHMAIVVDEYGGTQGIVTLEDVLEEIMGDITDESDLDEEVTYIKLNENEYDFDAKTQLNDFYKIMELDEAYFDEIKGDAETLAGLMLEIKQGFPEKGENLGWGKFSFLIEDKDHRRIKRIRVKIEHDDK